MKSVVHNFLGTFASRNSDHDQEEIDLLGAATGATNALAIASRLAQERFREQVVKAGFDLSHVRVVMW
jgi:hypothetical protein